MNAALGQIVTQPSQVTVPQAQVANMPGHTIETVQAPTLTPEVLQALQALQAQQLAKPDAVVANPNGSPVVLETKSVQAQQPVAEKTPEQVQAMLDQHLAKKAEATPDPFAEIKKILSGNFAPVKNGLQAMIEKFTGIGRKSVEAAVDKGFGTLQSNSIEVRNTLTGVLRSLATAFSGLAEASDDGKFDLHTAQLAADVKKAINELPQTLEAAMATMNQLAADPKMASLLRRVERQMNGAARNLDLHALLEQLQAKLHRDSKKTIEADLAA